MSRARAIGTLGETGVTKFFAANGFPTAERRALHGALDRGDIWFGPDIPIVVEVKTGRSAQGASRSDLYDWWTQTEVERRNAHAKIGLLVVQRRGYGVQRAGLWWCMMLMELPDGPGGTVPAMVELDRAVRMLRRAGYGEPL